MFLDHTGYLRWKRCFQNTRSTLINEQRSIFSYLKKYSKLNSTFLPFYKESKFPFLKKAFKFNV